MDCPECGSELCVTDEGRFYCDQCDFGTPYSERIERETLKENPESRAYREAGHAVMSYLIRQGFTDEYVPISRSSILPAFEQITIEGQSTNWSETTVNLGSLFTSSQVLLAGMIAQHIKYGIDDEASLTSSIWAEIAEDRIAGYIDEYMGDNVDFDERDRRAAQNVQELISFVDEILRTYWTSVNMLANTLLKRKTLAESEVFSIIVEEIPEEAKMQAAANLSESLH